MQEIDNSTFSPSEKVPFFQKKNFLTRFFYLIFFLFGGVVLFSVFSQGLTQLIWGDASILNKSQLSHYYRFTQTFVSIGSWLLPALLFGYLSTGNICEYACADKKVPGKSLLAVVLLSVALLPAVGALAYWNEHLQLPASMYRISQWIRTMEEQSDAILELIFADQSKGALILNICALGLLPALCEEFFFRGAMQPLFEQWTRNKHLAVWITAFIFSAIHLEFLGFFPRLLLGAYLGYLFVWSRSIWLSATAHFMHNALSVVSVYIASQRNIDLDAVDVTEYLPIIYAALIISITGITFLYKNRTKENQKK